MTAVEIASRPGLWRRAGQSGVPCGLDWGQVEALIPAGTDRDRVLALCRSYETGLMEGAAETARRHAKAAKDSGNA
ncbi:hypothetical protein [Brevundimonas diminuta]|uniref:hypothetical protein n=1 Tax=Brevundimonas diminuta TaxID=293 RepID=UPI003D9A7ED6